MSAEGITIVTSCFSCDVCHAAGPWEYALEHMASKSHRKKLGEVVTLEFVDKLKERVPAEEKIAWAALFSSLPLEPPQHVQTVRKIQPASGSGGTRSPKRVLGVCVCRLG